ncbi:MAG: antitoxin component YwqK of YwqJK toxin-antitoxin module [Planctomycetota bacterium]|jgi:antitoxin component YwqK of YwqJK toxin-antitoxin module
MQWHTIGIGSRLAVTLLAWVGLSTCALLPPTIAVALPPSPQRPEGPGERITRNEDGKVLSSAEYWVDAGGHEIRHGVEAVYWPDGQIKAHREFVQGTPYGHWRTYWKDGVLRSSHEIETGQATPMAYFHPNGEKAAQGMAVAGKRTGPWTYWFSTGVFSEQGKYLEGKRHGLWRFYWKDGTLKEEALYKAGLRIAK